METLFPLFVCFHDGDAKLFLWNGSGGFFSGRNVGMGEVFLVISEEDALFGCDAFLDTDELRWDSFLVLFPFGPQPTLYMSCICPLGWLSLVSCCQYTVSFID